jgi:hypothetical protein
MLSLDNLGNVVFASTSLCNRTAALDTERSRSVVWNFTNNSGRYVANGTYLVLVEAKGQSGTVYWYQTKISVNR